MNAHVNETGRKILIYVLLLLAGMAVLSSWGIARLVNDNQLLQVEMQAAIHGCERLQGDVSAQGAGIPGSSQHIVHNSNLLQTRIKNLDQKIGTTANPLSGRHRSEFNQLRELWSRNLFPRIDGLPVDRNLGGNGTDNRNFVYTLEQFCSGLENMNLSIGREATFLSWVSTCLYLFILFCVLTLGYLVYVLYHESQSPDERPSNIDKSANDNEGDSHAVRHMEENRESKSDQQHNFRSLDITHKALIQLIEDPESIEPITLFLSEIESLMDAESSAIFVSPDVSSRTLLTSTDGDPDWLDTVPEKLLPHATGDSDFETIKTYIIDDKPEYQYLCIRLHQSASDYSLLVLKLSRNANIPESTISSLLEHSESLANIVSSVLLVRLKLRHAHYEERSMIARELHDSLAQSLTYLKIQTSRLQNILTGSDIQAYSKSMEIDSMMQDLRTNLNIAYRHLRDLISTFRLTMGGKNFTRALNDSVSEFAKRSGIAFDIDNRLPSNLLTVTQETQLLHIIRESLSNVVRHSHAKYALISIHYNDAGRVKVTVKDDGIGLPDISEREQHFGIIIMQERAHSIGGAISLEAPPEGGACLTVTFQAGNRPASE